jgi:hypothetical protein
MKFAFAVGQRVEVFAGQGRWKAAIVTKLAPMRDRPGYYISWDPAPVTDKGTGICPSAGGWQPENCLREVVGACYCVVCGGTT